MDPVSAATAALAFATAVKDIVELAQKIHESFAKVPRNRRKAKRTAENVKEMVDEIRVFCEAHKDTLANMKEFTTALESLLKKFRGFEGSILPLVAQRGGFLRATAFLRGWLNNNKIEESILEVESNVVNVMRKYMMHSAMRLEVNQEATHQDTTRRLEGLSQGLNVVRTDVHAIRISTTVAPIAPTTLGTADERERNIVLYARSAFSKSKSLLRPPDEVTEEVWITLFIKSQVHFIEAEVAKVSTLRLFDPSDAGQSDAPTFSVVVFTNNSMEIACLRQGVVRELMDLRDALSGIEASQPISVDDAATQLNNVSFQLSLLGLEEESKLFLDWTVKLARALVNVPGLLGEAQHRASLALYLYHLSRICADVTQSRQAIEESLSITETLLSQNCTDTQMQGVFVDILLDSAQYVSDNESAITRCIQAIQLLEGIFQVKTLLRPYQPRLFFVSMSLRCADAFYHLAKYTLRTGWSDNAKRLAHLSIALRRRMVSVFSDANQPWLANTLSSICRGELAKCFTHLELLRMVDECALLFRQLTVNNPVYYSQHLLHILWQKADILDRLNRNSDSVSTREEVVSLAGQVTQDFKFQADALFRLAEGLCKADRYLDAARTMARIPAVFHDESHGWGYANVSHNLLETRHYKESAEAASNSVAIYRKLRPDGPAQETGWTHGLISALSALAVSQIALGDHTRGFSSLNESVGIASNNLNATVNALPDSLAVCLYAFEKHVTVSSFHNKEFAINPDCTPIQTLQQLAARHPQNKDVFKALAYTQTYFAYHLYCLGRLQDTLAYANQSLEAWAGREYPAFIYDWYSPFMRQIKAKTLNAQGYTFEARLLIQLEPEEVTDEEDVKEHKVYAVSNDYYILLARVYEVQLSIDLGDQELGLDLAEEVLQQSRCKPKHFRRHLALSLFGVAYAALHSQDYQRSIEAAGESINLSAGPGWVDYEVEEDISIRPSLFAVMSSAQANTGNLERAIDYAEQAVTLSLDIAERKHDISETMAKSSLMETRGYLAEVLLATGEVSQAREICHERKVYFTERIENKRGDPRVGEYRDLAPILRMLGVLCCHEGRHDEGEVAARELTGIMNRLGLVFPSLQEQVKIQLRYQASVPILKVLDEMTEKLDCEHQKGITALFKY